MSLDLLAPTPASAAASSPHSRSVVSVQVVAVHGVVGKPFGAGAAKGRDHANRDAIDVEARAHRTVQRRDAKPNGWRLEQLFEHARAIRHGLQQRSQSRIARPATAHIGIDRRSTAVAVAEKARARTA